MSSSWHDFLFASLDRSGVMTVDKPPLALWVQALSARLFGYGSLSVLVPQALMGMASVALVYDLVRRRFGRLGGFVAGLALALTPMTVAVSRHNNPDALLVLCSVAAVWCVVRGLQDRRTRWLVLAGVCVGLGFETKMGVALTVVPGIAAAWLWVAPAARALNGTSPSHAPVAGRRQAGGRLQALRQLLYGGAAMVLVGGAWPALVELTPASGRPWISGTSDNRVLSLIFGYNGLGRVDGQTGGPPRAGAAAGGVAGAAAAGGAPSGGGPGGGGAGGTMFGGSTGPLRLLNDALGGQAGWLLGFALVGALAILVSSRLRRSQPSSGWLLAVGGAFATTAVLFSFASGIFHPYYVSLLAPFAAALAGAGTAQLIAGGRWMRALAALAVVLGVVVELVVRSRYPGQLTWLAPALIVVGTLCVAALLSLRSRSARTVAVCAAVGVLLLAPGVWAFDTLGHAANGTFPEGGPASALGFGGGPGGLGMRATRGGTGGEPPPGGRGGGGGGGGVGSGGLRPGGAGGSTFAPMGARMGTAFGGSRALTSYLTYVKRHGGGTIAVASQSSAATAIIQQGANVAGIGGFSGRESGVSVAWLADEVRTGKIRWVLDEQGAGGGGFGGRLAGDTRTGSRTAIAAAARACRGVTISTATSASASAALAQGSAGGSGSSAELYDCQGRAGELTGASTQQSAS
jgi:4-amino-4-deoxy-L-arabinose transferase-like glycosyltransferase